MPNPHFDISIVQRSKGKSAVAGAAYQSGEKLFSAYDQTYKDYRNKHGIVYTEILLPPNAPPEYADRATLWNAAEEVEKQWNSQLARRFVLALPREIPSELYPKMVRDYCEEHFVSKGMCCDFAIHDPHPPGHNPHCHVMLTMRAMDEHGKWLPKTRKVYDLDENGERIRLPSGNWKSHKWFFIAEGGERRRWYGNISSVLNWENSGRSLREFNDRTGKSTLRNVQYMFKDGITYTYTSMGSGIFNAREVLPGMASIGVGPVIVDCTDKNYMMAFVNSVVFRWFWDTMYGKVSTFETGNVGRIAYKVVKDNSIELRVDECIQEAKSDWDSFETSWDFKTHPLVGFSKGLWDATATAAAMDYYYGYLPEASCPLEICYLLWQGRCNERFNKLKANEEELNRIFIDIYGLQDELTPEVEDKDVTVRKADLQRDIKSLLSYAVGCMFGRYSTYKDGLLFAGEPYSLQAFVDKMNERPGTISAEELERAYRNEGIVVDEMFFPDADNVIPITDEEYLDDDIVSRLCAWLKAVYGADTLEANLDYIAKALGNKGSTSREIIRNYFLNDFFKDHCQTYSVTGSGKRPIYWLFDSGKQNGFKALVYLHRYTPDTIGNLRIDYLHKMQRVYESEINRMQDMMDHSGNAREVAAASKRKDKLAKQLKECREYDEKISHLALSRIELDLDDGVKVNYRKLQTAQDGKFYEVLADSKNIMVKEKK